MPVNVSNSQFKIPQYRHTDESRYPAKQTTRVANKTDVGSLREAHFMIWIPTFVGMTGGVGA
jgi:hypothetical protein